MKDLGMIVIGMAVIAGIVFGAVKAGDEPAGSANTRNATTVGPPAPQGVTVQANPPGGRGVEVRSGR